MKLLKLTLSVVLSSFFLLSCNHESNTIAYTMDSLMQTIPDFNGVILIADKGVVKYHKAFGFRSIENKIALDTGDIFELASVSKQFTAMIIMMLNEEGKLHYDDSLSFYIPGLPYKGITIRHLLTHTSGLPDYQAVMDQYWDKSKIASNDDNIKYLIQYRPPALFSPGQKYDYSNTGYMLLATVAEKVSGEEFISMCRRRIFSALNMSSTDIRTNEEKKVVKNFAPGYIYVDEEQRYVPADSFPEFNYAIWLGGRKGPGRVSSTTSDLLKWDRALYSEKLVKQSTLQEAFSPMKLGPYTLSQYGFAWELRVDRELGKIVFHTGTNPGYKVEIMRCIDADKTIIVLSNNAYEAVVDIVSFIKAKMAPEKS
jgi:CubicO group peptidase (beta-lactamase class C family)